MLEQRRPELADAAAVQLLRRQPRRHPRAAAAPVGRARPVRRRRALRDDLRRVAAHVLLDALGPRPRAGPTAPARVADQEADQGHRRALRPDRPGHARAGHEGRPQRHRPRRPHAALAPPGARPARPAVAASSRRPTATCATVGQRRGHPPRRRRHRRPPGPPRPPAAPDVVGEAVRDFDLLDGDFYVNDPYPDLRVAAGERPGLLGPDRTSCGASPATTTSSRSRSARTSSSTPTRPRAATGRTSRPTRRSSAWTIPSTPSAATLVSRRFTPRAVTRWDDHVRETVTELVDAALAKGRHRRGRATSPRRCPPR